MTEETDPTKRYKLSSLALSEAVFLFLKKRWKVFSFRDFYIIKRSRVEKQDFM